MNKKNRNIIFIGGIHGVGKGTICEAIGDATNSIHLVASELLQWNNISDPTNKNVKNISFTQNRLLSGFEKAIKKNKLYLLDGHFCLFNSKREVEKIKEEFFFRINPKLIVVATTSANTIKARLEKRDARAYNLDTLERMQNTEIKYAKEIASFLDVPFLEVKDGDITYLLNLILQNG